MQKKNLNASEVIKLMIAAYPQFGNIGAMTAYAEVKGKYEHPRIPGLEILYENGKFTLITP
jgi:hypothetical protein